MTPFFGTLDSCGDFLNIEVFPKFEDKPVDKWNEIIKPMAGQLGDGGVVLNATHKFKALSQKDDSKLLKPE